MTDNWEPDLDDEEAEEEPEAVEIDAEFEAYCDKALTKIGAQIDIATKAIDKAVKLSEKYGVPFESNITPLSMSYTPANIDERFQELDSEQVYNLVGAYLNEYEGWEHSSIC